MKIKLDTIVTFPSRQKFFSITFRIEEIESESAVREFCKSQWPGVQKVSFATDEKYKKTIAKRAPWFIRTSGKLLF